jgi:SNF2 family DNA or RNA helicase
MDRCKQIFRILLKSIAVINTQQGNGLTTHHLVGSALTAHELLALNVDVVVVSYDQVEASFRGLRSYVDNLNAYIKEKAKNPSGKSLKKPKRPISALHSVLWRDINMPIKILALDEAQMANKSNGKRHQAIQALYFKSVIVLSGTLAHNKWDNLSGMIAYLRNHPFSSHARFMKAFSVQDYKGRTQPPDMSRMRRLQTFLQANLVARPASTITLPDCERRRAHFVLPPEHANGVAKLTFTYEQLRLYNSKELSTSESSEDAAGVIAKAMEAMMLSLHPLLHREFKKKKRHDRVNGEFEDAMTSYIDADNTTQAGLNRDNWLERVRNRALLGKESARIQCFVKVYRRVRQERPEEKVVIFSPFLKHLDIVHEVLRREFNVTALRYDGTVPLTKRTTVENAFKNCHPEIPLLLTSGAGGVGLNLTCASVMIQMEVWWNGNVEKQALFRLWRQRQQKPVLWVQLFATNSAIDCSVLGTQVKKTSLNSELMEPLIRKADEDPIKLDMFPRYNLGTLTFPEYDNLAEDT